MRILDRKPSLQIVSQSRRDCSEAAGDVSSMYSTPNASRALAIAILVFVSKNALANCSPSIKHLKKKKKRVIDVVNKVDTSQCALDDAEIRYIREKIGCSGSIWIQVLSFHFSTKVS